MIIDIFSLFDPFSFSIFCPKFIPIFIAFCLSIIIYSLNIRPLLFYRTPASLTVSCSTIFSQLIRTSSKSLKGLTLIVSTIFSLIIFINLLGLAPYSFRPTRHLFITLSIGLSIWLRMIISTFSFRPRQSTAHLLPDGAPDWLNPFLILIETSRILVRPLTLSFRLAANITAGHVVLSLISSYASTALITSTVKTGLLLLLLTIGYTLFEFAICLIQAYIFCLLLSLYRDDHAH